MSILFCITLSFQSLDQIAHEGVPFSGELIHFIRKQTYYLISSTGIVSHFSTLSQFLPSEKNQSRHIFSDRAFFILTELAS